MQTSKWHCVGDGVVGKTCLPISYITNKFPSECVPTVFDNYAVTVMFGGEPYTLGLSGTTRQEECDKLWLQSYPQTVVFLVCLSVGSPSSCENMKEKWVPGKTHPHLKTPFLLVETQIALIDDTSTIEKLARTNRNFWECWKAGRWPESCQVRGEFCTHTERSREWLSGCIYLFELVFSISLHKHLKWNCWIIW